MTGATLTPEMPLAVELETRRRALSDAAPAGDATFAAAADRHFHAVHDIRERASQALRMANHPQRAAWERKFAECEELLKVMPGPAAEAWRREQREWRRPGGGRDQNAAKVRAARARRRSEGRSEVRVCTTGGVIAWDPDDDAPTMRGAPDAAKPTDAALERELRVRRETLAAQRAESTSRAASSLPARRGADRAASVTVIDRPLPRLVTPPSPLVVVVPDQVRDAITDAAHEAAPRETAGLMYGTRRDGRIYLSRAEVCHGWRATVGQVDTYGTDWSDLYPQSRWIAGLWHTHPTIRSAPRLSDADLRFAAGRLDDPLAQIAGKGWLMLLASSRGERFKLDAWHVQRRAGQTTYQRCAVDVGE